MGYTYDIYLQDIYLCTYMLAEHTHVFVDLQLKKAHVTFFSVDVRSHTTTNIPVIKSFKGSIKPKYASVYTEVKGLPELSGLGNFPFQERNFQLM